MSFKTLDARGLKCPSRPPNAGPMMKPSPNMALITPKFWARRSGGPFGYNFGEQYASSDANIYPISVR